MSYEPKSLTKSSHLGLKFYTRIPVSVRWSLNLDWGLIAGWGSEISDKISIWCSIDSFKFIVTIKHSPLQMINLIQFVIKVIPKQFTRIFSNQTNFQCGSIEIDIGIKACFADIWVNTFLFAMFSNWPKSQVLNGRSNGMKLDGYWNDTKAILDGLFEIVFGLWSRQFKSFTLTCRPLSAVRTGHFGLGTSYSRPPTLTNFNSHPSAWQLIAKRY